MVYPIDAADAISQKHTHYQIVGGCILVFGAPRHEKPHQHHHDYGQRRSQQYVKLAKVEQEKLHQIRTGVHE